MWGREAVFVEMDGDAEVGFIFWWEQKGDTCDIVAFAWTRCRIYIWLSCLIPFADQMKDS